MTTIRKVAICAAVATLALLTFALWRSPPVAKTESSSGALAPRGEASVAGAARGNIATRLDKPTLTSRGPPRAYETELRKRVIESKNDYALFRELQGRADAEAMFFRAVLLETCQGWGATYRGESSEQRNARANAGLTGPYQDLRKSIRAKYADFHPQQRCREFPMAISVEDVNAAYKAAANAGDPRAQLDQMHRDFLNSGEKRILSPSADTPYKQFEIVVPKGPTVAEVELLRSALASKDPTQILVAGPMLTAMYSDYELAFDDGQGMIGVSSTLLWRSIACHFSDGCDANSQFVVTNCVANGRCDVSSYDEVMQKYFLSEEKWAKLQDYRATLIKMIETQNWGLLKETRGPRAEVRGSVISTPSTPRFQLKVGAR